MSRSLKRFFKKVKKILTSQPVLPSPYFNKPFLLQVDASDHATGAVLLQESPDKILHPVCYLSIKFNIHLIVDQFQFIYASQLSIFYYHFEFFVCPDIFVFVVFVEWCLLVILSFVLLYFILISSVALQAVRSVVNIL